MSTYRTDDGSVVDTTKAQQSWAETTEWNGSNAISKATGSQWDHQTLYKSSKGRYYIEHTSQVQGRRSHVEWVTPEDAVRWLVHNEHELPADLAHLAAEVVE